MEPIYEAQVYCKSDRVSFGLCFTKQGKLDIREKIESHGRSWIRDFKSPIFSNLMDEISYEFLIEDFRKIRFTEESNITFESPSRPENAVEGYWEYYADDEYNPATENVISRFKNDYNFKLNKVYCRVIISKIIREKIDIVQCMNDYIGSK
jgi:hypothetical protein